MGFAFEELKVYQRALEFAVSIIEIVDELDTPRKHSLIFNRGRNCNICGC